MCLHGALCSIPFNVLCNMTTFSKKYFDPTQGIEDVSTCKIFATMLLHVSFPLIRKATHIYKYKVFYVSTEICYHVS